MKTRENISQQLVKNTKDLYQMIFKNNKSKWNIDVESLAQYDKDTIGYGVYDFLSSNQLSIIPYFESHDVCHVMADYSIGTIEEIKLQYFLLVNGKRSVFQIGTIVIGTVLFPEYIKEFIVAYQRGQNAHSFYNWNFQHLLKENIHETKKIIFSKKTELKQFNHIHF